MPRNDRVPSVAGAACCVYFDKGGLIGLWLVGLSLLLLCTGCSTNGAPPPGREAAPVVTEGVQETGPPPAAGKPVPPVTRSAVPAPQKTPPVTPAPARRPGEAADEAPADDFGPARPPTPQETPHFQPEPDRWHLLDKYAAAIDPPYEINKSKSPWDPYNLNTLKGDYPVIGDDIFFNLEGKSFTVTEGRRVPIPTGTTGPGPVQEDFFGDGDQFFLATYAAITLELFKGQQFFKPVDWRIKITGVANLTFLDVQELGIVNINPKDGRERTTGDFALEQALLEIHIADLNDRYDFISSELGIFPFRSDFRGFVFDDINLGARIFGNADDNKWQYNLAFFHMLEKDTNSELNMTEERDQQVLIANVFREDWPVKGWTQSFSFHWNHDDESTHFDRNDFLTRPAPVGTARPHQIDAFYLGYAGDGHIGRMNFTYAVHHVFGRDTENPFAGKEVQIDAQFAALELSQDFDWFRVKLYGMYASGDDDPRDGRAKGWDAIVDNPNFAGGGFSFFNRATIPLKGTRLTNRFSPLPDLTTSRFEGQANYVNPGLLLIGAAADVELTPESRVLAGVNYLRFMETEILEQFLHIEEVDQDLGVEVFLGVQYRPLLTNNIIINLGGSLFFPGNGFEKMYETDNLLWHVFLETTFTW